MPNVAVYTQTETTTINIATNFWGIDFAKRHTIKIITAMQWVNYYHEIEEAGPFSWKFDDKKFGAIIMV